MSLDHLPVNLFDFLVLAMVIAGLTRGRKHGLSEELVSVLMWLAIAFGCAAVYAQLGDTIGQFTTVFGHLTCYLIAYLVCALLIVLAFLGIRRVLGGKLLGSDVFGRSEYYLGMLAGVVRFTCILLVGLALLNARYFSPKEARAMEAFQDDMYGSNFFPTLQSVQSSVFEKSFSGPWIKENLAFLLIKPTAPENKDLHQKAWTGPGM